MIPWDDSIRGSRIHGGRIHGGRIHGGHDVRSGIHEPSPTPAETFMTSVFSSISSNVGAQGDAMPGRVALTIVGAEPGACDGDRVVDASLAVIIDGGPEWALSVFSPDVAALGPFADLVGRTVHGELWSMREPVSAQLCGPMLEINDRCGLVRFSGEVIGVGPDRVILDVGFPVCTPRPAFPVIRGAWLSGEGGLRLQTSHDGVSGFSSTCR